MHKVQFIYILIHPFITWPPKSSIPPKKNSLSRNQSFLNSHNQPRLHTTNTSFTRISIASTTKEQGGNNNQKLIFLYLRVMKPDFVSFLHGNRYLYTKTHRHRKPIYITHFIIISTDTSTNTHPLLKLKKKRRKDDENPFHDERGKKKRRYAYHLISSYEPD